MGVGLERVEEMREQKAALLRGQLKAESAGVREALARVLGGQRLREEDGEMLLEEAGLGVLSLASTWVRLGRSGVKAFYNRNRHIEPTNVCCYQCRFCAYRGDEGAVGSWKLDLAEIRRRGSRDSYNGRCVSRVGRFRSGADCASGA